MDNETRKSLEEFISPGDFPLFDLAVSAIDDLVTIQQIFRDRNTIESTGSFTLGIIKSVITSTTGVEVDMDRLMKLIGDGELSDD